MSDLDAFESGIKRILQAAHENEALPPDSPDRKLLTAPAVEVAKKGRPGKRKHAPKPGSKADTKAVLREALAANEGGDYAVDNDSDDDAYLGDESVPEPESPLYAYDQEKAALLARPPVAFIEPPQVEYLTDYTDTILPRPGFVTDFINTSRGMEVPTVFMLWGALWAVSSILARHAWLKWYPKKLWPNLYCVLVAMPGLCTKSTALDVASDLVIRVPDLLPSNIEQFEKTLPMVTGKATADGILRELAPEERIFLVPEDNSMRIVQRGSKAIFNISELTTFLNNQQYNANLTSTMTALYDCRETDSELTRGRGREPLRDIYVTFIGGTTPEHMKTSMPAEALGGGFMSRTVVVYQDIPTKIYPQPLQLAGYPSPDDIIPRLAWIAHHARGEYVLTPEAQELYSAEYYGWKQRLMDNVSSEIAGETRYAVILLKVAMLLRAQEYRLGNDITVDNVRDAIRIMNYTLHNSKVVTDDVGKSDHMRWLNSTKRIIGRKGAVTRAWLQQRMSAKGCRAESLDAIVRQLVTEEFMTIELDGRLLQYTTGTGKEVYSITAKALEELGKDAEHQEGATP